MVESTIGVDAGNSKIQRRVETINGVGARNVVIQRGRAESTNEVLDGNSEIQRRVDSTNGDGAVNAEIQGGRSQSTNGVAPRNFEFQNGAESVDGVAANVNSNNTSLTNPQNGKRGRGLNKGRPTPSNPSEKIELHLLDNNDFMEDGVPQDITSTEKYCWDKDISETVYNIWYDKADRGFRDSMSRARKAPCIAAVIDPNDYNADFTPLKDYPAKWLAAQIWNDFVDNYWSSDVWRKRAEKASKNRNSLKEGSITKHTAGSRSFSKWRHSMKKPSGEYTTHAEVFQKTHTRRTGGYVDPKSELVIKRYNSALKEKHGEGSAEKIDFDPAAWKFAVGETSRGHLYGFGSFQNPRAILEGSSRQNPTNHSNMPAEIPEAMKKLFQKWLSEKLPGMLNSWGYHPSANASANNSTISASSRGNEVLQSSQNDSEKTASDGDNDDYPEDLC
ncbi:Transposase, Ptta/En/Spm, plant [Corchorus capsularis]|uniref:Transposase, Ptta/En/Spm, plant n=1 Tax=Corchorus capsularis TaxID=210143 RepID=A0A1R3J7G9_COCAP|nr:Transposase, Ptta/En/Spm, plant [Corchorus capsularis]